MSLLRDMLKNPSGTYDAPRILFAVGGLNGVVSPVVFQTWAMIEKGAEAWDAVAYCAAYGGMLAAIMTAGGLAIATKDKGVATAQNTTPIEPGGGKPD